MNKILFRYFYYLVTSDNFSNPSKTSNLLNYFYLNKYVIFYFYVFFVVTLV